MSKRHRDSRGAGPDASEPDDPKGSRPDHLSKPHGGSTTEDRGVGQNADSAVELLTPNDLGPALAVVRIGGRNVYRRVEFMLTREMLDLIGRQAEVKLSPAHSRNVILDPMVNRDSLHKRLKAMEDADRRRVRDL